MNTDSYRAALLSAGGVLQIVDTLMTGTADNGFALVCSPGHHSRYTQSDNEWDFASFQMWQPPLDGHRISTTSSGF